MCMGLTIEKQAFSNASLWKAIKKDIQGNSSQAVSYDGRVWTVGKISIPNSLEKRNCFALWIRRIFHSFSCFFSSSYKKKFNHSLNRFQRAIQKHAESAQKTKRISAIQFQPRRDETDTLKQTLETAKATLEREKKELTDLKSPENLPSLIEKQRGLLKKQSDWENLKELQSQLEKRKKNGSTLAALKRSFHLLDEAEKSLNTQIGKLKEKYPDWKNLSETATLEKSLQNSLSDANKEVEECQKGYQEEVNKRNQKIEKLNKEIEKIETDLLTQPEPTIVPDGSTEPILNETTKAFLEALENLFSYELRALFETFLKNCKRQLKEDVVANFEKNNESLTLSLGKKVWLFSLSYNKNNIPDARENPQGGSLLIFGGDDNNRIIFSKSPKGEFKMEGVSLRARTPVLYRKFIGDWAQPRVDTISFSGDSYEIVVVQTVKLPFIKSYEKYVPKPGFFSNILDAWGHAGEICVPNGDPLEYLKKKREAFGFRK